VDTTLYINRGICMRNFYARNRNRAMATKEPDMICPVCGLTNPGSALKCDCGYTFQHIKQFESYQSTTALADLKNCPYCGESILVAAIKCKHCGEFLSKNVNQQTNVKLTPISTTPFALIATVWILVVFSFFPLGQVNILISIGILICAIFLIASKNGIAKANGWFVLLLWIVTFSIGFFVGFTQ